MAKGICRMSRCTFTIIRMPASTTAFVPTACYKLELYSEDHFARGVIIDDLFLQTLADAPSSIDGVFSKQAQTKRPRSYSSHPLIHPPTDHWYGDPKPHQDCGVGVPSSAAMYAWSRRPSPVRPSPPSISHMNAANGSSGAAASASWLSGNSFNKV